MRNLIFLIVLVVACVVGIGIHRDWIHISSVDKGDTSKTTITVDKDKLHSDEDKAARKAKEAEKKVEDGINQHVK